MKIQIIKASEGVIVTNLDLRNITNKGEISHAICELERVKMKLLQTWQELLLKESGETKQ